MLFPVPRRRGGSLRRRRLIKLLGLLLNPLFLTALRRFTLVAPMDNWDYPIWECWLIGLGWLAASTLLGLLLFQRREIN